LIHEKTSVQKSHATVHLKGLSSESLQRHNKFFHVRASVKLTFKGFITVPSIVFQIAYYFQIEVFYQSALFEIFKIPFASVPFKIAENPY